MERPVGTRRSCIENESYVYLRAGINKRFSWRSGKRYSREFSSGHWNRLSHDIPDPNTCRIAPVSRYTQEQHTLILPLCRYVARNITVFEH